MITEPSVSSCLVWHALFWLLITKEYNVPVYTSYLIMHAMLKWYIALIVLWSSLPFFTSMTTPHPQNKLCISQTLVYTLFGLSDTVHSLTVRWMTHITYKPCMSHPVSCAHMEIIMELRASFCYCSSETILSAWQLVETVEKWERSFRTADSSSGKACVNHVGKYSIKLFYNPMQENILSSVVVNEFQYISY
jgi:hypothetical protein